MTAVDHAELKRLEAELVQMLAPDQGESAHPAFGHAVRIQNALDALLSEIEGLKAERDDYRLRAAELKGKCDSLSSINTALNEEVKRHLRTQAPDSWRPDREAVARIVDFQAWDFYDRHIGNPIMLAECKHEVGPSLAKADAILALRPQTAESGK